MLRKILNTDHSYFCLFQKQALQEFYKGVYNSYNNNNSYTSGIFKIIKINSKKRLFRVNFIPQYLNLAIKDNIKLKKIELNSAEKGFLVNLKNHKDINTYLLSQFSSKSRTKIRSNLKRLELCFNITYKFYYGSISKKDYDFLFKILATLLKTRFLEINKEHQALKNWKQYQDNVYDMVLNKTASIFVIFDDDKPIDICISYHFDNITLNHIRSFDIDYSKFRLGYLDIYKQLEWSFEHGFEIFDLSMGTLRYKEEWCNEVYTFKHHIIFNKKRILNYLLLGLTKIYVLITNKIFIIKSRQILKEKSNNKLKTNKDFLFSDISLEKFNTEKVNYIELNVEDEKNRSIRKFYYEFLYLNKNSKASTKLFKNTSKNKYVIRGTKKIQELELIA